MHGVLEDHERGGFGGGEVNNPLKWGRWYADHIDNPDYLLLNDTARTVYNEVFCLCCKDGGIGETKLSLVALRLRRHPNQIKSAIQSLAGVGWVEVWGGDPGGDPTPDPGGDRLGLPGWFERQPRGDHTGGSRVAKYRENKQLRSGGNVTRNAADRLLEREREVEGESEGSATPPMPPASGGNLALVADATDAPADTQASGGDRKTRWTAKTFTYEQAVAVFDLWREYFKKGPLTKFSTDRVRLIHARAKEGMTLLEAKLAVLGCFEEGKKDMPQGGKRRDIETMIAFTLIFRNRSNVERFRDIGMAKMKQRGARINDDGTALVDRHGNIINSVRS